MGYDHCPLTIGTFKYDWLDYLPDYLLFMFDKQDLRIRQTREDYLDFLGYCSSADRAVQRLNKLGYDLDFVCGIYEHFRVEADSWYNDCLGQQRKRQKRKVKSSKSKIAPLSAAEELSEFVAFLDLLFTRDFAQPYLTRPYKLQYDSYVHENTVENYFAEPISVAHILDYAIQHVDLMPPAVVKVLLLFSDWNMFEYADVMAITLSRLLLECVTPSSVVSIDLRDHIDSSAELEELYSDTPWRLSKKVNLYKQIFNLFTISEPNVRIRVAKEQALVALRKARAAAVVNEKGRLLESALVHIFQAEGDLTVVSQRYDVGDEELDLVLKNNLSKPFWISLNSPLLFVECKNWSKPVSASECRNFEVKLMNHSALTKLGIFVAASGFTEGFHGAIKRIGRSDHMIALIDGQDLEQYCTGQDDLLSWLEAKICTFT